MDEATMKRLLGEMKSEIVKKIDSSETSIMEKIRSEIKTSEEAIKNDINDVKKDVAEQKTEIEDIKNRLEEVEKVITYAEATAKPAAPIKSNDNVKTSEISEAISIAKCKVGIKPITLDDIDRIANKCKLNGYDALKESVKEFLRDELKFDNEEIEMLKDFKVKRKDTDDNDKVYVILENEELAEYMYRKAAVCKNDNVTIFPFIPP